MAQAAIPLFVASSLMSFAQKRAAGAIDQGEAKVQARQTELAATAREADRKDRLATALASQNASAGARGIAAFEGSPLTILQADIEREEKATQRDMFSTELEAFTQRSRGSVANRQAKAAAFQGLISAGSQFASMM